MILHRLACAVSERVQAVLRDPLFILLFPIGCAAWLAAGWLTGAFEPFMLALTTLLSIVACWQASMVMLRQARDAGEIPED